MRLLLAIILISATCCSCEEQFGNYPDTIPKNTIDNSIQMFSGNILEQNSEVIEGIEVWKVRIENEFGATVSFYWQKNYNILYLIIGEHGPFDYELKPPLDIIVFSTAKFLAFESYSAEPLVTWKLIRDKSFNSAWVYQFFLKDGDTPVSVKASSGDIL